MQYLERSTYVSLALVLLALLAGFFVSGVTRAAESCGSIIAPDGWENSFVEPGPISSVPILDCLDPFEVTIDPPNPYTLSIGGVEVAGDTLSVPGETFSDVTFTGEPAQTGVNLYAFRHEQGNLVYTPIYPASIATNDYLAFAETYFTDPTIRGQYMAIVMVEERDAYFYDANGEPLLDTEGEVVVNRFYNFMDAAEQAFVPKTPELPVGTYTFVWREYMLFNTYRSIFDEMRSIFAPTAYAFTGIPPNVYTKTVTITSAPPTPVGASSVLFLPGIMGSRLYEGNDICEEFVIESERWFSTGDCAQLRLLTDSFGNSINDIYTKNKPEAVIDETFGLNLYKSFFADLESWKSSGLIDNYSLVPYDWRLRLDELIFATLDDGTGQVRVDTAIPIQDSYLYTEIKKLAAHSKSKKVTIVAHSNGGLLAKMFLVRLEQANDPLLDKIDNLILVGSPQVGTPDTIVGMLHGTELGPNGFVVSQQTARTLLNTMPFAFHLLPNESYFSGQGVTTVTPVITFEQGTVTTPWINRYGAKITDASKMEQFMCSGSGRIRPESFDLNTPEVVGQHLFDTYTKRIDEQLNTWTPPQTLRVKEVAGVGVETVSGITYFTDTACINRNIFFRCIQYAPKLGMRPNMTIDGDGTVVAPSALAMGNSLANVERYWINLRNYNNDNIVDSVHKSIFEVDDVSNFVANTILATTSYQYEYISKTPPVLPNTKRLTFTLHSPLDLQVRDSRGVISSTTQSIEGGLYRRFGEIQYASLPDEGLEVEVLLNGVAAGSFTLEVATVVDGVYTPRDTYAAIPSGTSTKVLLTVDTDTPPNSSRVFVDYDGNGTSDITYDTKGEVVPVVTYDSLLQLIQSLEVKPIYKKLLLENARLAQKYDLKSLSSAKFSRLELISLEVLKQQVYLYHRKKILSTTQKDDLIKIINHLVSNI